MLKLQRIMYRKNVLYHPFSRVSFDQTPLKPLPSTYKTDKHAEFLRPFMSVQLSISRIQLLVPKQVYISYICSKYIL